MRWLKSSVVWGVALIALGILFLLQTFGILGGLVTLVWILLFGAAGVAFLIVFLTDRAHWWALIPGFTLLGLSALIALDWLFPRLGDAWGGALFLGAIGLSFWAVYFFQREHWWAVISGGVMFTLALVAALSSVVEGTAAGGIFFLGIGLTFALFSAVNTPQGRMRWALIPAAVLSGMGVILVAAATPLLGYLWPAALVVLGLFLLSRAFVSR